MKKLWRNKVSLFILGLFLVSISVYAFTVPSGTINKIENALMEWQNGTNTLTPVSTTNPLPILAEPGTNTIGAVNQGLSRSGNGWWVTMLDSNGNYIQNTDPFPVQVNFATQPSQTSLFSISDNIPSTIAGINLCALSSSAYSDYFTQIELSSIPAAGTTEQVQIVYYPTAPTGGTAAPFPVGTAGAGALGLTAESFSAAPTPGTVEGVIGTLENTTPATITSDVEKSLYLSNQDLSNVTIAPSTYLCVVSSLAGANITVNLLGYEVR